MINRAKQRHIAYVFFTIALIFIVLFFLKTQVKHSDSNWYVTVNHGDPQKIFTFYPNIPYTVNSDDYILYFAFMSKNGYGYKVDYSEKGDAPEGLEKILGGFSGILIPKVLTIICKDTTYFTLTVQLSGFIFESGHYEIHKNVSGGRRFYYDNKKRHFVRAKDF